jgi:hypothetical protein
MKNILIVLVAGFVSCVSDESNVGIPVSTEIEISLVNKVGADLLSSIEQNSYNPSEFKIYYERDGKWIEFFNQDLDYPRNFLITKKNGKNLMRVFLEEKTVIDWGRNEFDTLTSSFHKLGNGGVVLKNVWYKGELVYDNLTATDLAFLQIEK